MLLSEEYNMGKQNPWHIRGLGPCSAIIIVIAANTLVPGLQLVHSRKAIKVQRNGLTPKQIGGFLAPTIPHTHIHIRSWGLVRDPSCLLVFSRMLKFMT